MKILNEAIAKSPEVSDLYLYLAIIYEDANQYEDALKALDRGLEKLPNDTELLFRKGVVAGQNGQEGRSRRDDAQGFGHRPKECQCS